MARRLVIGTTNPAKVQQMRAALGHGFVCVAIDEVATRLPAIAEVGDSAADIAALKAVAYAAAIGEPVLSLDHWLRFDGVEEAAQPGGLVRRIPGNPNATDDEMLAHYVALVEHGGELLGRWTLGVAVAGGRGVRSTEVETVRRFVATPSDVAVPGLPLSRLQVDLDTGRSVAEQSVDDELALWTRVYGPTLVPFVVDALASVG